MRAHLRVVCSGSHLTQGYGSLLAGEPTAPITASALAFALAFALAIALALALALVVVAFALIATLVGVCGVGRGVNCGGSRGGSRGVTRGGSRVVNPVIVVPAVGIVVPNIGVIVPGVIVVAAIGVVVGIVGIVGVVGVVVAAISVVVAAGIGVIVGVVVVVPGVAVNSGSINAIIKAAVLGNCNIYGLMVSGCVHGAEAVNTSRETSGQGGGKNTILILVIQTLEEGKDFRIRDSGAVDGGDGLNGNVAVRCHDAVLDLLGSTEVVLLCIDEITQVHVLDVHREGQGLIGGESATINGVGNL